MMVTSRVSSNSQYVISIWPTPSMPTAMVMLPGGNCANESLNSHLWSSIRFRSGPPKRLAISSLAPSQSIAVAAKTYAIFPFTGACEALGSQVRVGYDLMFGSDAQHRGLVDVRNGNIGRSAVMTPETRVAVLDLESDNRLDVIRSFISHGAHHIWSGYDHMLFLVTLLLSAVVMRSGNVWRPG